MHSDDDCVEDEAISGVIRGPRVTTQFFTWSSSPTTETQPVSDYEALLLAIAGHDLRQPLQAIQSAHENAWPRHSDKIGAPLVAIRTARDREDDHSTRSTSCGTSSRRSGGREADAIAANARPSASCSRERVRDVEKRNQD